MSSNNDDFDDNIDDGYSGFSDDEEASAFATRSKKSGDDTSYSSWMGESELERRNTIKARKAARKIQGMIQNYATEVNQKRKKLTPPTTKVMDFTFLPERIMTLMHKDRLKNLEQTWKDYENGLNLAQFVQLMIDHVFTKDDDEKYELIYGSYKLFQEVDINGDGQMEWGEFMQYIIDAVSANAIKGGEDGGEKVQDQIARIEAKKFNRFTQAQKPIDKSNHSNTISQAINCGDTGKILAFERFGTDIKFYDHSLSFTKKKTVPVKKEGFITGIAYDAEKELYGITCSDSYIHFYQQSKVRLEYVENALIWTGSMQKKKRIKDNDQLLGSTKIQNNDLTPNDNIQTKIWYMPKQKLWLTAGKDFKLRHWAVHLSKAGKLLQTLEIHTDLITDCVEVDNPVCIATCSMDRTIVLFDIEHQEHLRTIDQGHEKGIRHLRYQSVNGNQMISIGNETYANVWAPESLVSDVHIGTLRGHKKGIVDGAYLKMAPYFVTLDEIGHANFWDIHTLVAIQTIPSNQQTIAEGIIVLSNNVFWAFGRRFFQYDTLQADEEAIASTNDGDYPISVQLNYYLMNIFVVKKHQIRMYDIVTGKLQSLHTNLFHDENSKQEMTCFKIDKRHRKAYIASNQGYVIVVNCQNGVIIKNCTQHIEDAKNIKNMARDQSYESIISIGTSEFDSASEKEESDDNIPHGQLDSAGGKTNQQLKFGPEINDMLLVWEDEVDIIMMLCADSKQYYVYDEKDPENSQLLRKISGGHVEEITILAFSFHLSLVSTGCINGEIAVYDFEMSKCESMLKGHQGDITALEFMDPYPLLISASMDATVCIWGVRPCPHQLQYVCVKRFQNISWKFDKDIPCIVTRLMVWNLEGKGIKKYRRLRGNQLPATSFRDFEQNFAFSFRDFESIFNEEFPQPKHSYINYPEAYKMQKVLNGTIYKELLEDEKSKTFVTQKQTVGEDYNEKINELKERNYLVLGDEFGYLKLWDFTEIYKQIGVVKVKKFIELRQAFNPYRQETVDCSLVTAGYRKSHKLKTPIVPKLIDPGMTGILIREAQAHNDVIKNLSKMKLEDFDAIVTGAKDKRVRVWSLGFDLLGNINGKTDLDDQKWKVPSTQRVINRENDLKSIEKLMDDIDMGLKSQRLKLIVDESRQLQQVDEKVKTRANWQQLQEDRDQKAKELDSIKQKADRNTRIKHERGEMVSKKIIRMANEQEIELQLLSNVDIPNIPDSGFTAELSGALQAQQQEMTVGLAQQIVAQKALKLENQGLNYKKKTNRKLTNQYSILSKTSNRDITNFQQTRTNTIAKQETVASIQTTQKKPSEITLNLQPQKVQSTIIRHHSPEQSGETTRSHAKPTYSGRSLSQVQNYSDVQSQHFKDSLMEKDLISQRSRAPKIRTFLESLKKKDRFNKQPESFSAMANYSRAQVFGNRQFSIADSEIQRIAELEGNGLIKDASQATMQSSIEQYENRRKSKIGKLMNMKDNNNEIKSSQVDLINGKIFPIFKSSRNDQALLDDYTGNGILNANRRKQVKVRGLDLNMPVSTQEGTGQSKILQRNPLALKFQTIQQESDRFKSMDRNQKYTKNDTSQVFGLPQIQQSITKGSVSFGATQTMRGAKSALSTSPQVQMSSNTNRNSKSILSARNQKSNKDFESLKTKYAGSNSLLVEEQKTLKERLEYQRNMVIKLKKQKFQTISGGL